MTSSEWLQEQVRLYFTSGRYNCTMTTLKVLTDAFGTPLHPQVLDAARMVPGAGGTGGLCGLVTGALMFVGLWSAQHHIPRDRLRPLTRGMIAEIRERFGSVQCEVLEGDCSQLAVEMLSWMIPYLRQALDYHRPA
ncbi:MAG: C-GCAxxG-C-C family (seleno)protein [Anaerolineales bacterium]